MTVDSHFAAPACGRRPRFDLFARYAALGFVIKGLTLPLVSYLPPVYAEATGFSLSAVGALFLAVRLSDVVLDPVVGYVSDRFDPPLGRRKFWVCASAGLLFAVIPFVFRPTMFSGGPIEAWIGLTVALLIFHFAWTMMTVAHAAWPVELTAVVPDRARLIAWREWAGVLGMLAMMLSSTLVEQVGHGRIDDQLLAMGGVAMIALPFALAATLALPAGERSVVQRRPDPFATIGLVRASPVLRRLLLADLLSGCGFAIISATSYFLLDQRLGLGSAFALLTLLFFVGLLAGIPLFLHLTIRFGRSASFSIAMIGAAGATLSVALVDRNALLAMAAVQLAAGLFTGGYQPNLNAMMASVAARHDDRAGTENKGAHFALLALTNKLGYALAIGVCYAVLDRYGGYTPSEVGSALVLLSLGGAATCLLAGGAAFLWASIGFGEVATATRVSIRRPLP